MNKLSGKGRLGGGGYVLECCLPVVVSDAELEDGLPLVATDVILIHCSNDTGDTGLVAIRDPRTACALNEHFLLPPMACSAA